MKSNDENRQPVWQRPKIAVRTMGISESTLFRWLQNGTVRTMKIDGVRFVDVSLFSQAPLKSEELQSLSTLNRGGSREV